MSCLGTVKNGVVIPEPGASLPEGARVRIEPVEEADGLRSLREGLLRFAGSIKDMPADSARNHDHYLYGADKK